MHKMNNFIITGDRNKKFQTSYVYGAGSHILTEIIVLVLKKCNA